MAGWTTVDVVLLAIAAYVAVTAFVRLMQWHRDKIVAELQNQWQQEQQRKAEEELRERKKQAREARQQQDLERRGRRRNEAA